jgi:hypothetical protein
LDGFVPIFFSWFVGSPTEICGYSSCFADLGLGEW